MHRLGILLSGRGSNFEAIVRAIETGELPCEIAAVISNRAEAPGLRRAQEMGLPAFHLPAANLDRTAYDDRLANLLEQHRVGLVCLAGYLRLLSSPFVQRFAGRILNIHPSLLPAFPGLDAQYQAWVHGVKISGCTVHLVNDELDSGPILMQATVEVRPEDSAETLAARILSEEHRIYPEAIRMVLKQQFRIEGRRVVDLANSEKE